MEIRPGDKRLVHHAMFWWTGSRMAAVRNNSRVMALEGWSLTIESEVFDPTVTSYLEARLDSLR